MAQVKFLSQTGLATVWQRIREVFATKEAVEEVNELSQDIAKNLAETDAKISTEANSRAAADEALTQSLEDEATARQTADNNLMANVLLINGKISTTNELVKDTNREIVYQHGPIVNHLANYNLFITRTQDSGEGLIITEIGAEGNDDPHLSFYRTGTKINEDSFAHIVRIGTGTPVIMSGCEGCIKSFTIDGSVRAISNNAFRGAKLEEVIFAERGVQTIEPAAFAENLFTSITLPYSLFTIGDFCFQDCAQLKYVTLNCEYPPTIGADVFSGCDSLKAIYVPSFMVEKYKNAWPTYANLIQPKSIDSGSQEEIDKVNEKVATVETEIASIESEIEDLRALIEQDYTNVSEVGA